MNQLQPLIERFFTAIFWTLVAGVLAIPVPASGCSVPNLDIWPCSSTVYYSITGFATGSSERSQIEQAIDEWNFSANGANVTFVPASLGHPAKYTFVAGTTSSLSGQFAYTKWFTVSAANRKINRATTTYYLNNTFSTGGPVFDSTLTSTYSTIFVKVTLHEIGHTMGLNHPFPMPANKCDLTDGITVMNDWCGTNDSGNNGPIFIQSCDNANVSVRCPMPTPTPGPSGGCNGVADFNQFPTTGCTSGFTAIGSTCGLSLQEQEGCSGDGGYDDQTCGCSDGFEVEPTPDVTPTPTATATPTPEPDWCLPPQHFWEDCLGPCHERDTCQNWDYGSCYCMDISPIMIDILGNGFGLTNAVGGVWFDIRADGSPLQLSWTSANTDDAWLALDRNENGLVDNGAELFGNFTAQPTPPLGSGKNGFLALAVFDRFENGGNSDGFINRHDLIFTSLRLWQDANHNGISEASELFTLPQLGLRKMHLDYQESRRTDEHGNRFKYRARVKDAQDAQLGRWAWDVFLVKQP